MKNLFVFICLLFVLALPLAAQDQTNIYAVGVSYNNGASPAIAGTGLYAHLVDSNTSTYMFTVVDALPINLKPFTVSTNFGAGIAQKIATIGKVPFYIPTSAGISYNGTNTGWAWSTGVVAAIKIKANGNLRLMPNVRIVKSSVSNNAGYQPVVGFLVGWGQ